MNSGSISPEDTHAKIPDGVSETEDKPEPRKTSL